MSDANDIPKYKVLHPDGEVIFLCVLKKANWYYSRGLAVWKSADTIQLTFEPNGRGEVGNEYALDARLPICAVCGSDHKLTRHHVVPKCYRRCFPHYIKKRAHNDILLLCEECHVKYERQASKFKLLISQKAGFKTVADKKRDKTISYARALLRHGDQIPPERINVLWQTVADYVGTDITNADLIALTTKKPKIKVGRSRQVTYQVLLKYLDKSALELKDWNQFAISWRIHFVNTMQPKHAPSLWNPQHEYDIRMGH